MGFDIKSLMEGLALKLSLSGVAQLCNFVLQLKITPASILFVRIKSPILRSGSGLFPHPAARGSYRALFVDFQ